MTIRERLEEIKRRINSAATRAGRDPSDILLLGVTKGIDTGRIREGIEAGIKTLGESRVQEALPKIKALGRDVTWHFIGPLQRNKVKYIIGLFELIHSLDNMGLAEEIDKRYSQTNLVQKILVEVNVGGEESKHGVAPEDTVQFIKEIKGLRHLEICGLMTIPPFSEDPEDSRPYFRMLYELYKEVHRTFPDLRSFHDISMGMSNDFEIAIEEGATIVRIGTALFGGRDRFDI